MVTTRGINKYLKDWNAFAKEILGVRLDRKQREILFSIQKNRKITIRSSHARGKDYLGAVASLCFLFLNYPSKVILSAPTQRQAISIMMSEISKIYYNANVPLGGELLTDRIRFPSDPDWYLIAFKTGDKKAEKWTGFHSPNIMVVLTEASGIEQETFDAIEGILTGNSKIVLIGNPIRTHGEFYKSFKDNRYQKYALSALRAVNVRAKKELIPGQVDYNWVADKVDKWCKEISLDEFNPKDHHFKWNGKYYKPNDLFIVKVIGDYTEDTETKLIPLHWLEMAVQRWHERQGKGYGALKLGVDVAGMGRDMTAFAYRRGNVVEKLRLFARQDHMVTAGKVLNELKIPNDQALIDTIGEGAGVHSRLNEQGVNSVSVKFSESAKGLTDKTGERTFLNMRAFCYWAVRDALDPELGGDLALPPDDDLAEELNEITWKINSNGSIQIDEKEKIKERLGRSPDRADAVALSFAPKSRKNQIGSLSVYKRIDEI